MILIMVDLQSCLKVREYSDVFCRWDLFVLFILLLAILID